LNLGLPLSLVVTHALYVFHIRALKNIDAMLTQEMHSKKYNYTIKTREIIIFKINTLIFNIDF